MKSDSTIIDHFTDAAKAYDERNLRLAPISANMHFLIGLILKSLPARARVLCVGVGTGAEILALARLYPEFIFVGVDPSIGMIEVCRERLAEAGALHRCELIQGYADDLPQGEAFDAALSILVAHFVKRVDRLAFYQAICKRLGPNGVFVDTEISFDLDAPEFPSMLRSWAAMQSLTGATPESLANLSTQLRDVLTVLPPAETEDLLKQSGIPLPVRFFQAFMICGWYGVRSQ